MNALAQVKQKHRICTTARSKYESLGTELWSAWPVHSDQYTVHTIAQCTQVLSAHKYTVHTSADKWTQVHTSAHKYTQVHTVHTSHTSVH